MEFYSTLHTPLVLVLCISGTIGHILSIGVLLKMLNPTNILLISMSINQLLLCVNFLYSTLFKAGSEKMCLPFLWSFGWTFSLLISVNLSVFVHMLSTFHLVALSIIRHLSLQSLSNIHSSLAWFTYRKAVITLIIIYTSVLIVCTPLYFQSRVVLGECPDSCVPPFAINLPHRTTAYRLRFSENALLQSINFWLFGSICKLIPCSILCLMTYFILKSLKKIRRMSAKFGNIQRDRQYHRTTKVILMVMLMFMIVETPQGILAVAQSIFRIPHLDIIGDVVEVITLLNSCLIFALFCSMNSRIRSAFREHSAKICLWASAPNDGRESEEKKALSTETPDCDKVTEMRAENISNDKNVKPVHL
ncbi:serpentine type 7TM GPCR chemoreceptor srw domain-containing protein [Ditylenchus destructor]|uniref:Serpentine type 7TM GPCR chemoreceptor srw domain-containing protein n=1 Tax=Ditylenchus destructor TaxID=166010 RepID=A0AAD4N9Q9_9BILA|nr:serpentine type 7TM GPCR chemoreceptor srw domain-containing protein [Ditylenchus destructor]